MKVADIMTSNVLTVQEDAPIEEAIRLMLQHRISGLVVTDKAGHLAGMVTEGDFLRRRETDTQKARSRWLQFLLGPGKLADEYTRTAGRKVGEVMTHSPQTVAEDAPLAEAIARMERHHIKRLPVMRGNEVIGIVSRANFLRALASAVTVPEPTLDDSGIRQKLLAEFDKQPWGSPNMVDVTVKDGTVHLWGTIVDERSRSAMVVAAENIPGVKDVRDHLAWIEPMSGIVITPPDDSDLARAS
jgi:CBS domain-containing protein